MSAEAVITTGKDFYTFNLKYKPKSLNDYIGMDKSDVTSLRTLKLTKENKALSILGDSGTGKTAFASIIAQNYLDLYSIKGGFRTVDVVSELTVSYRMDKFENEVINTKMPYVFIIDDADMLTFTLQRVLSEVVKQASSNILFIFCSTSISNLNASLLGVCDARKTVSVPSFVDTFNLINEIASKEGIKLPENFLSDRLGVDNKNISIRDALLELFSLDKEI